MVSTGPGANWTRPEEALPSRVKDLAVVDGVFYAAGGVFEGYLARSADGFSWTVLQKVEDDLGTIDYTGDRFVATGDKSLVYTSEDGSHWVPVVGVDFYAGSEGGGAFGGGVLLLVGGSRISWSFDQGTTWHKKDFFLAGDLLHDVVFVDDRFFGNSRPIHPFA